MSNRRVADRTVAAIMRERIVAGDWPPNRKILSEQELAQIFSVNPQTIRDAIAHLGERGYLKTVPGKGTIVRPPKDWPPPSEPERDAPNTGAHRLYTPQQVSRMFKVDPQTVLRWAQAGKIRYILTPGGRRRYLADEIDAFLQRP